VVSPLEHVHSFYRFNSIDFFLTPVFIDLKCLHIDCLFFPVKNLFQSRLTMLYRYSLKTFLEFPKIAVSLFVVLQETYSIFPSVDHQYLTRHCRCYRLNDCYHHLRLPSQKQICAPTTEIQTHRNHCLHRHFRVCN
jgi:hypothetical protein